MYMRLTWAKVRPASWDRYQAKYKEVSKMVPGLKARWFVRDMQDRDALYVVALWETLEAIHAWEESAHYKETYGPALTPFLEGQFTVSVCEVLHTEGLAAAFEGGARSAERGQA